jgi:hypothetical protein
MSIDLIRWLSKIIKTALWEFGRALRSPTQLCKHAMSLPTDEEKMGMVFRLWSVSFLLAIVLEFPRFKAIGIEANNWGFHAPNFLVLTLLFMLNGAALHFGMRRYRIPSNFYNTITAYTIVFSPYYPILTVVSYLGKFLVDADLKRAKLQHETLLEAIANERFVFQHPDYLRILALAFSILLATPLLFFLHTLLADRISHMYAAGRSRIISAMAFGMICLPLLSIGFVAIYYLNLYENISPIGETVVTASSPGKNLSDNYATAALLALMSINDDTNVLPMEGGMLNHRIQEKLDAAKVEVTTDTEESAQEQLTRFARSRMVYKALLVFSFIEPLLPSDKVKKGGAPLGPSLPLIDIEAEAKAVAACSKGIEDKLRARQWSETTDCAMLEE